MRNYFTPFIRCKNNSVGADPISARYKSRILIKISVGDGFPVPRRKAFLENIYQHIIC